MSSANENEEEKCCYLHAVEDPNETHYDPSIHNICLVCAVKLWELAQKDTEFNLRDQTVFVATKKPKKSTKTSPRVASKTGTEILPNIIRLATTSRKVTLTTGYEVDLEDEEGLEHLFNAIIGEVTTRLRDTEEFSEKGFGIVYDVCICELHYLAGQLQHMGSGIRIEKLLDEFGVQWDRVAEKLGGDSVENE